MFDAAPNSFHFVSGPRPMDVFQKAMPFRLLFGLIFAALVYWTYSVRPQGQEEFPLYYFAVILFIYALHQVRIGYLIEFSVVLMGLNYSF